MRKPTANETRTIRAPYSAGASEEAVEALKQICAATRNEIGKDRLLELSNEATDLIYCVETGWLMVAKTTEEGQRQIIDFVLPGDVYDPGSAAVKRASADLSALSDAKISMIPRTKWNQLLADHPDLKEIHERQVAAGYARLSERMLRIGKSHAEAQIAYAVCELCLHANDLEPEDGSAFHLPLTQQVLGDFLGLSSVHVSRTLRRLRRQNVLSTGDQMDIIIHDIDRLAEVAEVDLEQLRAEIIPAV
ncbi:MAG: Crp/Fnr family transcriptional regulator [Roseovarius sp.]